MGEIEVELRQLVGQTSTAAGVFEVSHDIDMVMIKTPSMERPRHYGYVGRDRKSKFLALPQYRSDFPEPVRRQIEQRINELAKRDVGCVQTPSVQQHAAAAAKRADADPVDD